jgi:nitrite reductase/ring-hydroxylating ferredoxin subunit
MSNEHFICSCDDIQTGTAKGFCVNDVRFFIVNNSGNFLAYINSCPHLKIPLEWQENSFFCQDTDLLRCSTHGALFLPENGLCVSGPCVGQSLKPVDLIIRDERIYWVHQDAH